MYTSLKLSDLGNTESVAKIERLNGDEGQAVIRNRTSPPGQALSAGAASIVSLLGQMRARLSRRIDSVGCQWIGRQDRANAATLLLPHHHVLVTKLCLFK
jgi:hypothetical protein